MLCPEDRRAVESQVLLLPISEGTDILTRGNVPRAGLREKLDETDFEAACSFSKRLVRLSS